MLLIACPHCGNRPETEFRCGGQAHIARPADPAEQWPALRVGQQRGEQMLFPDLAGAAGARPHQGIRDDRPR